MLVPFALADEYTLTTSGGGPNGYDKTSKTTTQQGTEIHTNIECSDPGYESCPKVFEPNPGKGIPGNAQQICVDYAEGQINNGVAAGSTTMLIGGVTYYLVWSSNSSGDSSIQITD